jgi:hypothetical protein
VIDKNGLRQTIYVRMGIPIRGNSDAGKGGNVEREIGKKDTNWYTLKKPSPFLGPFLGKSGHPE